jgi:hypothetical protein
MPVTCRPPPECADCVAAGHCLTSAAMKLMGRQQSADDPAQGGELAVDQPRSTERLSRWRHKKRGTIYQVIGVAEVQTTTDDLQEGDDAIVYRSEQDGKLWVRPRWEFEDGLFECLDAAPPKEWIMTESRTMTYPKHDWRTPEVGEPREEGAVCRRCLAFANSEGHLPCRPDAPVWSDPRCAQLSRR